MSDLTNALAEKTGLSVEQVDLLLAELAEQAYSKAADGFVLPGFGSFTIEQAPGKTGTNPFTGDPVRFKGPKQVVFTADTSAEEAFIEGKGRDTELRDPSDAAPVLPALKLELANKAVAKESEEVDGELGFKVGGRPDWRQECETPVCCGKHSIFRGQLDSVRPDHIIGDMGMIYVFYCDTCGRASAVAQW